jgi:hypothetical protein
VAKLNVRFSGNDGEEVYTMFRILLAAFALVLGFASSPPPAQAEPTPWEIARLICVGPGYIPDGHPYERMASLPKRHCRTACRAAAQSCKAVVRSVDTCGMGYLKATGKIGRETCMGHGGMRHECNAGRDAIKIDIAAWKAAGKIEKANCDTEVESLCLSRCQ